MQTATPTTGATWRARELHPAARRTAVGAAITAADMAAVRDATAALVDRYHGGDGTTGTFAVDLGTAGRLRLVAGRRRCDVRPDTGGRADVRITTDATTWVGVCEGTVDPIEAFLDGRIEAEGDLHRAVRLETLFAPTDLTERRTRSQRTRVSKQVEIASLVSGSGTPVLLLHGLAANLLSFLPSLVALSRDHEVHALDLPGFGRSSKPAPTGRRYHPSWMADQVARYVRRNHLGPVHVVGNSMGGRIAQELALRHPDLVRSITGLCPAVAFDHFQGLRPVLRLAQAQWAASLPVRVPESTIERIVTELFHNPGGVPPQNIRAAAGDAARMMGDRGYRLATAACARYLGSEAANGRQSYWRRISRLETPSFWLFGKQDWLVPGAYAHRVREVLPHAQVELWDALGHVPQFERPDETHAAISAFIGRLDRADAAMRRIGAR